MFSLQTVWSFSVVCLSRAGLQSLPGNVTKPREKVKRSGQFGKELKCRRTGRRKSN